APVDDHELAVVPDQIVRRTGYRYARRQEARLQRAQHLFASAVCARNQRMHRYTASRGFHQSPFDLPAVEPEDNNLDRLFGAVDCSDQRRYSVSWLYQQFHQSSPPVRLCSPCSAAYAAFSPWHHSCFYSCRELLQVDCHTVRSRIMLRIRQKSP